MKIKKIHNVKGINYEGVLISYFGPFHRSKIIVKDKYRYEQLTITDLFTKALLRTFYKDDENQINGLIKLINLCKKSN